MKKIIITLATVAITVVSSQAITVLWAVSPAVTFGGTNVGAGQVVDLIFLGNGGSFSYNTYLGSSYGVTDSRPTLGMPPGLIGTQTANLGSAGVDGINVNGNVYTAIMERIVGEKTYYNVATSIFTVSGVVNDGSNIPTQSFTFNYSTTDLVATWGSLAQGAQYETLAEAQAALWGSAGGGWNSFTFTYIPVPEPATAGLAFAGLALLFRRKRK